MNWNSVYEAIGLNTQTTDEHEKVRRLLEKSEVIKGDAIVGGVQDFYISNVNDNDGDAYDLSARINELCGIYEVEASFFVAAKHI